MDICIYDIHIYIYAKATGACIVLVDPFFQWLSLPGDLSA